MKFFRIFFLLVCTGSLTTASVPVFRVLQIDVANPDLRISTIYQDTEGYIWLGTEKGLWRYDGFRFDKIILDSLADEQQVSCLAQDNSGNLYAGLEDGGIFVRRKSWHRMATPCTTRVQSIVFTEERMWIATYGQGIAYREQNKWNKLRTKDNSVYRMVKHPAGYLLAGTDLGLLQINYRTNEISTLDQTNGLPDNIVRSIYADRSDVVILGTQEKGICAYNLKTGKFTVPEGIRNWQFGTVNWIELLANEFWIGTDETGILDYEFSGEKRVRSFNRENGFPYSAVKCILHDRQGNMWIAADNRLLLSPGEKTEFITGSDNITFREVNAVTTDAAGYVWLSSRNSLYRYNNTENTVSSWLTGPDYRNLHITSLAASPAGLWIGTFDNGLYLLDTVSGKVQRFDEKAGLPNANVISIAVNRDSVWLATLGGIAMGSPDEKGHFSFTDYSRSGAGRGFVYCVYRDLLNRIWFGTDGNGLVMYDGQFHTVHIPGNKGRVIYSIVADYAGHIWFSTQQDGLFHFDVQANKALSVAEGIRSNEISSLSVDHRGNIIVIHGKGIDLIDPVKFTIHPIGADAGIEAIEPTLNAVAKDAIGGVWIGTTEGLLRFYNYDPPAVYNPLLHIKRVYSSFNPASNAKDTVFEYDQNQVSVEYVGLWYGNPESVRYQYRLIGYNSNWISTRDRQVTFPNLPPGRYTFEVRATRNNTFSDAPGDRISFVVLTPFWKRWWFIMVSAIVLLSIIYLVVRERTRRLRQWDLMEKERIAYQYETLRSQVNPHFLFNSFNTLIGIIEEDQQQAAVFAGKLSDYFRNMVQYRDKSVISLAQELELVKTYYYLQQQRFGEYLTVSITLPKEWYQQFGVPPLSLQLLIENAVKHNAVSFETPLHITISGSGKHYLIVRNNLNPKTNPDSSTGIGLENIIHRYRIVTRDEVHIRKQEGYFEVELPLVKLAVHERADH